LRETAELTTAATAGWRRPVLLLPDDWRSWTSDERRAVLAHELAHVVRGDYATGLVARIALVLNTYHPLVRWTAGRLQLQQEQAADALAARFVGGPASYLVILARLALQQDGRSPRWPAREFLADRGTLLRRIAMLRDQSETGTFGRRSPGASLPFASLALVGLTIGVATLRGPARAAEDDAPAAATSAKTTAQAVREPFVTLDLINDQEAERTYKIGAYYKKIGKVASAEFYFGKIPQRWPNSPWADKARIELAQLARMSRKSVLP
ncbi:MAG: M56 family metallopeptidase, partial [Paludisphaera borealis]|uniref:M56 family metallopeptidase n=1 Tax=Paludisphaera borealis TaxID=1387353 RepID=UPI00284E03AF